MKNVSLTALGAEGVAVGCVGIMSVIGILVLMFKWIVIITGCVCYPFYVLGLQIDKFCKTPAARVGMTLLFSMIVMYGVMLGIVIVTM